MCINKMFSSYLKTERKKAGLTQMQLADKISGLGYKITNGAISYYETDYGKKNKGWSNRPPEKFIKYLALALGLDEHEAKHEAGYSSAKPEQLPPFMYEIDFSRFSEHDLKEIESFIRFKLQNVQPLAQNRIIETFVSGTIRADDENDRLRKVS